MLDIQEIRENPQLIKQNLKGRDFDVSLVDDVLDLDKDWREKKKQGDELRMHRNNVTERIEQQKKDGNNQKANELIEEASELKTEVNNVEEEASNLKDKRDTMMLEIPQTTHEDVPEGADEDDNVERRREGFDSLRKQMPEDVIPHYKIATDKGWLDEENAREVSGSGFYYLKGSLAQLEHALIQFMMDVHREQGYEDIFPPIPVRSESMIGTGQLPKFDKDSYKIEDEDLWLCPTAEVPVTNMHKDDILKSEKLPIKYQAYTPNFRREAGEHGTKTRGIARVHQFNKVELVNFVEPEISYDRFWKLLDEAEEVLRQLNLPYRTLEICSGDIGFKAARQIDIEVWAPGDDMEQGPEEGGRWLEVSTVSNFESFQARRMNTRHRAKTSDDTEYLHTLNGSGLALPRVVISIVEYYQNEDGSVTVPEVLRPYMNNQETL